MGSNQQNKQTQEQGISADALAKLTLQIEELEKRVKALELNDPNQWNEKLRSWIGKPVLISLSSGAKLAKSILTRVDRYTLLLEGEVIVHKGAVATIERAY